jgi:hypothetical protein
MYDIDDDELEDIAHQYENMAYLIEQNAREMQRTEEEERLLRKWEAMDGPDSWYYLSYGPEDLKREQ